MSFYETKEIIDWRKHALEYKSSYAIENRNDIIYIHDNKVKNINEWNLLHDIINHTKRAENINNHYYPIIHGCINIRKGKAKFNNSLILLDSGCSSMIALKMLVDN